MCLLHGESVMDTIVEHDTVGTKKKSRRSNSRPVFFFGIFPARIPVFRRYVFRVFAEKAFLVIQFCKINTEMREIEGFSTRKRGRKATLAKGGN